MDDTAANPPFFALLHNRRGERHLNETGDLARAADSFARATEYAPGWSVPWYNLGLAQKYLGRWAESLRSNRRASDLDPEDEAAWWNLGIAATAIGDWAAARAAWATFGIAIPPGEGEVAMDLGLTPIRLDPDGRGEVVWCDRIDPARAIIRNVPLPESGYRYGDLLLHDGAPSGERHRQGRAVPVFDMLQLLRASPYTTYEVRARVSGAEAIVALAELAESHDCGVEDWETIREICATCSRGSPDPHEPPERAIERSTVALAIAAQSDGDLRRLLEIWSSANPGCAAIELMVLVPGAPPTLS